MDLLKGIAVGAGLDNIIVEGANGGLHTNYTGKAEAAVDALAAQDYDLYMYTLKHRMRWDIREVFRIRLRRLKYRSEDHRTDRWGNGRSLHGFQDVSPSGSSDADLCPHTYR